AGRARRRRFAAQFARSLGRTGLDLLSRSFGAGSDRSLSGAADRQSRLYGIRHHASCRPGDRPAMSEAFARRLDFEGAINFRDLGGYPVEGDRHTRWRRLFRADSLADLTRADL